MALGEVVAVELVERLDDAVLFLASHAAGVFEVEDGVAFGAEDGALVVGGHVAGGPVFGTGDGAAGFVEHDDVAGEVFVDVAEAVVDPAAEGGFSADEGTRVHLEHGGAVDGRLGGEGVNEGDVIDAFADVGEEVGDPLAALAVLFEVPLGFYDAAFVFFATSTEGFDGDGFAVEAFHVGFVVEGVDVGGAAIHEEEDDGLGLGGEVGLLLLGAGEHAGEGEGGEAGGGGGEEFAAVGVAAEVLHGFWGSLLVFQFVSFQAWLGDGANHESYESWLRGLG